MNTIYTIERLGDYEFRMVPHAIYINWVVHNVNIHFVILFILFCVELFTVSVFSVLRV